MSIGTKTCKEKILSMVASANKKVMHACPPPVGGMLQCTGLPKVCASSNRYAGMQLPLLPSLIHQAGATSQVFLPFLGMVKGGANPWSKQARTCKVGKNDNSIAVVRIWFKLWEMIYMIMKYSHTKFEQEAEKWSPGMRITSGKWQT